MKPAEPRSPMQAALIGNDVPQIAVPQPADWSQALDELLELVESLQRTASVPATPGTWHDLRI